MLKKEKKKKAKPKTKYTLIFATLLLQALKATETLENHYSFPMKKF